MKLIKILVLLLMLFNACMYSDVKYPLDKDVNQTELGTKIGTASFHTVLWLFAWGDSGTAAAAKQGNLKVINHLDSQRFVILFGAYTKSTTIAYGE